MPVTNESARARAGTAACAPAASPSAVPLRPTSPRRASVRAAGPANPARAAPHPAISPPPSWRGPPPRPLTASGVRCGWPPQPPESGSNSLTEFPHCPPPAEQTPRLFVHITPPFPRRKSGVSFRFSHVGQKVRGLEEAEEGLARGLGRNRLPPWKAPRPREEDGLPPGRAPTLAAPSDCIPIPGMGMIPIPIPRLSEFGTDAWHPGHCSTATATL